jgi:hypothetical protein
VENQPYRSGFMVGVVVPYEMNNYIHNNESLFTILPGPPEFRSILSIRVLDFTAGWLYY